MKYGLGLCFILGSHASLIGMLPAAVLRAVGEKNNISSIGLMRLYCTEKYNYLKKVHKNTLAQLSQEESDLARQHLALRDSIDSQTTTIKQQESLRESMCKEIGLLDQIRKTASEAESQQLAQEHDCLMHLKYELEAELFDGGMDLDMTKNECDRISLRLAEIKNMKDKHLRELR